MGVPKYVAVKWCEECGKPIPRTRHGGHLESTVNYRAKRFCSRACATRSWPAPQMAERRVRLLLRLLRSRRYGVAMIDMVEEFEVSVRTVQRDLRVLKAADEVLEDLGKPIGLRFVPRDPPEVGAWMVAHA